MRGEPADEVAALLKAATLPVTVAFERAADPWLACAACGHGVPRGRATARGVCRPCADEAEVAPAEEAPAEEAPAEEAPAEDETAESWEDLSG